MLVITALAAHWAALAFAPAVIMDRALATLAKRNIALHAFTTPQRITPESQAVVRSSPDLFYSLCRFDFSEEGALLKINMGEWPDYQSLSFFDAETNNFATISAPGKAAQAYLYFDAGEQSLPDDWIKSPTRRGVILIRRLAPTPAAFGAAQQVAKADSCTVPVP